MKHLITLLTVLVMSTTQVAPTPGAANSQAQGPVIPRDGWREKTPLPITGSATVADTAVARGDATHTREQWWRAVWMQVIDNNWEIMIGTGAGLLLKRLTVSGALDAGPRLNKDATRIVFNSDRTGNMEIFSMDTEGDNLRQVTLAGEYDTQPEWMPGRNAIVFVKYENADDNSGQIFRVNEDGSGAQCLTCEQSGDAFAPTVSPDGTQIAYVYYADPNGQRGAIWLMNADGGNKRQLAGDLWYLSGLDWSPSGRYLAFDYAIGEDWFNGLGILNLATNAYASHLTGSEARFGPPEYAAWSLGGWAPDERSMFLYKRLYQVQSNRLVLVARYVMSADFNGHPDTPGEWVPTGLNLGQNTIRPDVANIDHWAPESRVTGLRPYVQSTQPLVPEIADTTFTVQMRDQGSGFGDYIGARVIPFIEYTYALTESWRPLVQASMFVPMNGDCGHEFKGWDANGNYQAVLRCLAGSVGSRIYLRSTITDVAGNPEKTRADDQFDASTMIYAYVREGIVLDPRGVDITPASFGLDGAVAAINTSGAGNRFQAYVAQSGAITATPVLTGFSGAPGTRLPAQLADPFPPELYLAPSQNLVGNGDFEGTLSGWQFAGGATGSISTRNQSGATSVLLHSPSAGASSPLTETFTNGPASVYADITGTVHMIWSRQDANSSTSYLLHASRPDADTAWTNSPATRALPFVARPEQIGLAGDTATGGFHAIFPASHTSSTLHHCFKPITGTICGDIDSILLPGVESAASVSLHSDRSGGLRAAILTSPSALLYYTQRAITGTWSTPVLLGADLSQPASLRVEGHGATPAHVAWSGGDAVYVRSLTTATWAATKVMSNPSWMQSLAGGPPRFEMAMRDDGTLELVHVQGQTRIMSVRSADGSWTQSNMQPQSQLPTRVLLDDGLGPARVLRSDTVTATWVDRADAPMGTKVLSLAAGNAAVYKLGWNRPPYRHEPGDEISMWLRAGAVDAPDVVTISVELDGEVFVMPRELQTIGIDGLAGQRVLTTTGAWARLAFPLNNEKGGVRSIQFEFSNPGELLLDGLTMTPMGLNSGHSTEPFAMQRDLSGTLHLVSIVWGQHYMYETKTPDGDWEARSGPFGADLPPQSSFAACCLAVTPAGNAHMVMRKNNQTVAYRFDQAAETTHAHPGMRIPITIPIDMHAPTLSFAWAKGPSESTVADAVEVSVAVYSGTHRSVLSSFAYRHWLFSSGWRHQWVDLSAWRGHSITLAFELSGLRGDKLIHIDRVSVGPWRTPVIHDVQPALIDRNPTQAGRLSATARITVTGENFPAAPIARIGGVLLPAPVFGSDTVLVFDVEPTTLPPGARPISIGSANGPQTHMLRAITIRGRDLYLPALLLQ